MEDLPITLFVAIGAVFVLVLVLAWALTSNIVEKRAPERQRLKKLTRPQEDLAPLVEAENPLVKNEDAEIKYASRYVPKSPKELSRIRRRLMRAGHHKLGPVIFYVWCEVTLPIILSRVSKPSRRAATAGARPSRSRHRTEHKKAHVPRRVLWSWCFLLQGSSGVIHN